MWGSFWSKPIDNVEETKVLSEKTSWKTTGRYISEPLNDTNISHVVNETDETKTMKSTSKEGFVKKLQREIKFVKSTNRKRKTKEIKENVSEFKI